LEGASGFGQAGLPGSAGHAHGKTVVDDRVPVTSASATAITEAVQARRFAPQPSAFPGVLPPLRLGSQRTPSMPMAMATTNSTGGQ